MIVGVAGFENDKTPGWLTDLGNPTYVTGRLPGTRGRNVTNTAMGVTYGSINFNASDYYIAASYWVSWSSGAARLMSFGGISLVGSPSSTFYGVYLSSRLAGGGVTIQNEVGSYSISMGTLVASLPPWASFRFCIRRVGGGNVTIDVEINGQLMTQTVTTGGGSTNGGLGFNAQPGGFSSNSSILIDDLVVQNGAGGIDNSGFAPLIRCTAANPVAAGSLNDFSITGGAPNKQTALASVDTQYCSSIASNAAQSMTVPAAPPGVVGCLGFNQWIRARRGLGSPYTLNSGLLIDGIQTPATGAVVLSGTFTEYIRSVNYKNDGSRISLAEAANTELLFKNN